ncbi:hypothetical protein [Polaromonas sp.]|uniref:hypothetical protein n=1 Tax=Polaromonas sp. TaxID=1869339 RepID=UPI00326377D0
MNVVASRELVVEVSRPQAPGALLRLTLSARNTTGWRPGSTSACGWTGRWCM